MLDTASSESMTMTYRSFIYVCTVETHPLKRALASVALSGLTSEVSLVAIVGTGFLPEYGSAILCAMVDVWKSSVSSGFTRWEVWWS